MQKFKFFKALCLSALLCLGGCAEKGMDSSQTESVDASITNAFGMKMDVTTKKQAKDILKGHGYSMVLEIADIRSLFSKRNMLKLKNKQLAGVIEKGASALFVPISTDFETNIQLFFDKDQRLIGFLMMTRDEEGKLKSGKREGFREDFSFEIFEKTDDGKVSLMIVSPRLIKQSVEKHLN